MTAPSSRFVVACLFAVALCALLAACQAGGLSRLGAASDSGGRSSARYRSGLVNLSDADLAPVDAYLSTRNKQWILGDTVDVYASKEYFSSMLTMNAKIGLVHRQDSEVGDDTVSVLTFIGHESQRSAMVNPRVMIGTGLTVTARKALRVRMAKTTDAARPIQLRVVAQGNASRGRQEQVEARGDQLELGGVLKDVGGTWVWNEIGGR